MAHDDRFDRWMAALEARHLADLTFPEVSRALRALSSAYVERRTRLREGAALAGAGKRAAFALFYGPLHYLIVRHIVGALGGDRGGRSVVIDVGCGTGAAGAAWATTRLPSPRVHGVDRHPWAVSEALWTYRSFDLRAQAQRGNAPASMPRTPADILFAFTVNEIDDDVRKTLLENVLERAQGGSRVLIVEPLAKSAVPWWPAWQRAFERAGGRADEWRVGVELPAIVARLDRAAGLNHRQITARSLWLAGR